ncbi:sugar ABC transporter permease [Halolactibacillus alkaliphilus]|uniref:Sugar ABC transporter permease n=1 Tax=Halolactibacillus alkaliphilus TaxID=442899 RepID=A0A511X3N0_9BACI|nr:carbohydrate ABC transporter permease [Halolactibacillus alkaliphilus]GEN57550.1 sugar ABC transporter permease [Halolactibacillus alkaliphilus]GGN73380.1 sugar ABC transporter permease [Halolactibacillus alkaliphilus]SFO96078.1 multiple sugar transport system permease protein [Halolactibacillus alkaliphilus]
MKQVKVILFNLILLAFSILTVVPFVWMLVSSFKPNSEIVKIGGSFLPDTFTIQNYINVQERFDFLRMFGNSLFVAVVVTGTVIYTSAIVGFALAKYTFKGREFIFGMILGTMMIPWAVTIIPRYDMIVNFGWLDSYIALILPSIFSGFGIFLLRQNIMTIPDDVIEAARMDGATEWYIFHRVILPMSRNAISSIAIFQFLWVWEDFLWPYLIINTQSKQLIAVGLKLFSGQYGTDYGGLFAATAISIIPVIIVYVTFQKRFIAGISGAAVKG